MDTKEGFLSSINKKQPQGLKTNGTPYTVLVVDDSSVMRKLISQILKSEMYEVCGEGTNGFEGVELYKNLNPDITTMDINMPMLDGLGALKEILKFDKDAKIVMLTSDADQNLVVESIAAGAKNYIIKPPDRSVVLDKVRSSLV
ncbi:MAG: response regulator [Spirochaetes bacterium]|nr:response regulator [Spirochaetota bacterium]MCK5267253.1 response regulator [Spirochaetota bacterium]